MAATKLPTKAEAAALLRCYESDVAEVLAADEGVVAVTSDGARYLLSDDGTFVWLRVPPPDVPQILGGS